MIKLINLLTSIFQLVTYILNKYDKKRREAKYEEVTNNPNSEWVNGFGVRAETKSSDPTKAPPGE
jgi:hypothetical protein